MGESSACLVRSLSQPFPTSQDSKEGDPIRHALTSSVSFGRFVSESLAWEKWSAFSHDRYLEDVEKYSRPGSVAEKKAYFEAHFKRIAAMKAARSLEQQNIAVNNVSDSSVVDVIDEEHPVEMPQEGFHLAPAGEQREKLATTAVDTVGNIPIKEREAESAHTEEAAGESEEPVFLEKLIESSIRLEDVQETSDNQEVIGPAVDAVTMGVSALLDKKIPISSPSKSSVHTQVSTVKPPVKQSTPIRSKIANQAMANTKKTTRVSADKNRSTPKSIHMSINFASHSANVKKPSSPLLHKIATSNFVTNLDKTSRGSMSQQTLTRASMNAFTKHLSAVPPPDNGRTKSLLRQSIAERVTGERKPKTTHIPLRSSTTNGIKERSPVVSPPFSLKSEERAAKRKEFFQKLEEKRKAEEAVKERLQGKLKGKTRNISKDLCHPLTSQANTNTSIDLATSLMRVPAKKISTSQPCSPMIGRKQSTELCYNSRPPWRHTLKMDNMKDGSERNYLPPAYSNKLLSKKSMRENSSPNIQH